MTSRSNSLNLHEQGDEQKTWLKMNLYCIYLFLKTDEHFPKEFNFFLPDI